MKMVMLLWRVRPSPQKRKGGTALARRNREEEQVTVESRFRLREMWDERNTFGPAGHMRHLLLAEWSAVLTHLFFPLLPLMSIEGVKLALVLAPNLRTGFDGHRRATSHRRLVQRLARCLRLVSCTVFTCSFHYAPSPSLMSV